WGFFTPPVAGADLRAALVASCLRGALPPVDLRAVCFVRAMVLESIERERQFEESGMGWVHRASQEAG
ncbi:unnamed protein product, partial [Laminaria digitata]